MLNKHIYEYLDTNGDGTGTINVNGDYSSAAEDFYYQATVTSNIARLIVIIEDSGSFTAENYGGISTLSNGMRLFLEDSDSNSEIALDGGSAIKSNAHWGGLCYDVDRKSWGAGNDFLLVRFSFDKAGACLCLDAGEKIILRANDDLSGLILHQFMIQGMEL